ncbi:class I SAM-dependent methyltransferase [Nocardia arthritidis]|uniref:Methyltransferase domain-containing protein n=1 Tax=Nocardia arthritidis TaxID=228602 RepID=A0A6G9YU88_9NOCA|nr:methyltransferase domain-containing protein [Nocardia arthritidis]QIS16772.1 methyltransferase domain-containing protein [Nocardia arthritidis]
MTAPTRPLNRLVTHFFDRAARAYDQAALQRIAYRPPQDEMLRELRAAGSRRIADIGCGTGIFTTRLLRELEPEAIYGIDLSEGMLEQARARSGEVTWLHSRAESLPFVDGELDAVVTTSAFHFFDQPAAVAEFRRVLMPDGLAAVATMHPKTRLGQLLMDGPLGVAHWPTPAEVRKLFGDLDFEVVAQRRVHRPIPEWLVPDVITVGRKRY